jgi:hypothetical protein
MKADDPAFAMHLVDNRIFPFSICEFFRPFGRDTEAESDPKNFAEIRRALRKRRSPVTNKRHSEHEFRRHRSSSSLMPEHIDICRRLLPVLMADHRSSDHINHSDNYEVQNWHHQFSFDNLKPLTDHTILPPSQATYQGIRFEQLEHPVMKEIGQYISPCGGMEPSLPFFCVETVGAKHSALVAMYKACYDGAVSARAKHALYQYIAPEESELYDNKAYVITCTYVEGHLCLYAQHPAPA